MNNCENCSFIWACNCNLGYCPKRIISKALSELEEREELIIKLHCGFIDGNQHSFADIGRRLNLSGVRISQIYKEVIGSKKYFAYLGVAESIVRYGTDNTNYAFFYNEKFNNYDSLECKNRDYFDYSQTKTIDGRSVPNCILKTSINKDVDYLNLPISQMMLSEALTNMLSTKSIVNVGDVLSMPFYRLFFDILEFDEKLYQELCLALSTLIETDKNIPLDSPTNYLLGNSVHNKGQKAKIKAYIKKYVFEYNAFFEYEECLSQWLILKAQKNQLADVIAECFFTDSIQRLITLGFDFFLYWQNSYRNGFDGEIVLNVIRDNDFPATVKKLTDATVWDNIEKLDIKFCEFSIPCWQHLIRRGIYTISDFDKASEDVLFSKAIPIVRTEIIERKTEIEKIKVMLRT